jgi:DNA-binding transcriptional regulator YhcF (GntR family)
LIYCIFCINVQFRKDHKMSTQNGTAAQQAVDFIGKNIQNGTYAQGSKLPPIRLLSHQAGVSVGTMMAALALLRQQGMISGAKNRRAIVGQELPNEKDTQEHTLVWQKKQNKLEQDLLSGVFRQSQFLPSLKELGFRYDVSFRTLQKMFGLLGKKGLIKRQGRHYCQRSNAGHNEHRRVIFITTKGHLSQISALNHEHNRIVGLFENECLRMILQLEVVEIDFFDPVATHKALATVPSGDSVLGYLYDIWWYPNDIFRNTTVTMVTRLASFRKPLAILDELGSFELPNEFAKQYGIQVFRIETQRAARRMAQFLIAQGHTSIAYISAVHHDKWSQDRYAGIAAEFSSAGLWGHAHLAAAQVQTSLMYEYQISGLGDGDIHQLLSVGRTVSQAKDLEKQWNEYKIISHPRLFDNEKADARLRKNMKGIAALLKVGFDKDFLEMACEGAFEAASRLTFTSCLVPLFERALKLKDVTAWICANDGTAIEAITYLRGCGRRVPEDIAVAGFDNIPVRSLDNQLTTFDFNAIGFVHQMLNFVARPPRMRGSHLHSPIEIQGFVINRRTTQARAV